VLIRPKINIERWGREAVWIAQHHQQRDRWEKGEPEACDCIRLRSEDDVNGGEGVTGAAKVERVAGVLISWVKVRLVKRKSSICHCRLGV
jgi:hypothetical protein